MNYKKTFSIAGTFLLWCAFSQSSQAMCYTVATSTTPINSFFLQTFQGDASSCPDADADNWIEVCVKPSGWPNYSMCGTGYGGSSQFTSVRIEPNMPYDFRARYRKTDGTLGIVTNGYIPAVSFP